MSQNAHPLIIEPSQLNLMLDEPSIRVIDLSKPEVNAQAHISGAVFLNYPHVVCHAQPVMGLLPDQDVLAKLFATLGISNDTHVIAYDDEGGGKASRLLWTLAACGHQHYSLLNGGLHSWANEGNKLVNTPSHVEPATFTVHHNSDVVANQQYILSRLGADDVALLDARTPAEFDGSDVRAARGGHIPGAVNMDWMLALDQNRNLRIKDRATLTSMLENIGVTPDKEVITYCHSHHRSALMFIALQSLGFQRVRGYPGSWSDWGNDLATPIEQ